MKIIDISLALTPQTIVYPNNPVIEITPIKLKSSVISKVVMGTHSGTHIDAPRHVLAQGKAIDAIPLAIFYGPCRVLDFTKVKDSISKDDLVKAKVKVGERILVKTRNSVRGFKKFNPKYIYLSPEGAEYLASRKIKLFGIDYLSVKQRGSLDNRPHTEFLTRDIPIFEGLDLSRAKAGKYIFAGLPLKFIGVDGAPARAVLIKR